MMSGTFQILKILCLKDGRSNLKHQCRDFSYFPFGGGPRSCIGEPLAWIEGIIVLANIVNNWKITLEEKDIANIKLHPLVTLRPKNGIRMKISKRSSD